MLKRFLGMVGAVFLLVGCTSQPPAPLPDLTFAHLSPVTFVASGLQVTGQERGTPLAEYDHLLPKSLATYTEQWASQRFAVNHSGSRQLTVRIEQADLQHETLAQDETLKDLFRRQVSEKYTGTVKVILEITEGTPENLRGGPPIAQIKAEATQTQTFLENATINQKRQGVLDLVSTLLDTLDQEVMEQVGIYLNPYVM